MKYLLVIAVIAIFYLYWKKQRTPLKPPSAPAAPPLGPAQQMVACAHCGLHLPARDALPDAAHQHVYCSDAHRSEGPRHP